MAFSAIGCAGPGLSGRGTIIRKKSAEAATRLADWTRLDSFAPAPGDWPAAADAGEPPTIDLDGRPLLGFLATYFEHGEPVAIAGACVITSAAGGIDALEISYRAGEYKPGDTLSIVGTLPAGITAEWVTAERLILRGSAGGAAPDDMEAALALVRYSSSAPDANAGGDVARALKVTVVDANGTSNEETPQILIKNEQIATGNDDQLEGTVHDDSFNGLGGNDLIYGRAGNDTLDGGMGNDQLYGEEGDDLLLISGPGLDYVHGGSGIDRMIVDFAAATSGLTSPYTLDPTADGQGGIVSSQVVSPASVAWHVVYDGIESIELTGSIFGDSLLMASTDDVVSLGAGDDFFYASGGNKVVHLGTGNDLVSAGLTLNDWYDGEDGVDTLNFSSATAGVGVSLAIATAQNTGGAGIDTYLNFERIAGSRYGDHLTGDGGANRLAGRGGSDTLTGGGGADVFIFENVGSDAALSPANIDTITDFELGIDRLMLAPSLFGAVTAASLAAGAFAIGPAAQEADDRILYDDVTGALSFDADGNGAGAAVLFASLAPGLALTAADFVDANRAPEALASSVALAEDQTYIFSLGDFGFADADGHGLTEVRIFTLPASGTLYYDPDGPGGPRTAVLVGAGQYFPIAEIGAERLSYVPAANANGAFTFNFTVRDSESALDVTAAPMTINVAGVGDAPLGADKGVSMLEDGILVLKTTDFPFSDVDGDSLAAVIFDSVVGGALRLTTAGGAQTILSGFPASVSAADIAAGRLAFLPDANGHGGDQGAILFRVSDGTLADPVANLLDVSVLGVNDAPFGTDGTITMIEDGARTLGFADFGFSDPVENSNFYGVRITSLPTNGTLFLNGAAMTGIAAGGTLVSAIQLSGGQLVFRPDANENGDAYAGFTFRVRDAGGTSNGGIDTDPTSNILTVNVTPVNDAPVVTGSGGAVSYVESVNAPPSHLAIDTGLILTDGDDSTLASAAVSITTNFHSDQDLLMFNNDDAIAFGNIGAAFDDATGVLNLSSAGSTATMAQWQAALRAVAYANTSDTPDEGGRVIAFAVNDGESSSNVATRSLTVMAQDDGPPHITGTEDPDVIDGTIDDDVIDGLGGGDLIYGHEGADLIHGGEGNDNIIGGASFVDQPGSWSDELYGDAGDDWLTSTDGGDDLFYGGSGHDELVYQAYFTAEVANVLLDGGSEDDFVYFTAQGFDSSAILIGGSGHDLIQSEGGLHSTIDAGADSDLVRILYFETQYEITLGAGADLLSLRCFTFEPAESAVSLTISDFAAGDGGDALLLLSYLPWVLHDWDLETNPFAAGYLRLVQQGADTLIQLDRDAGGSDWGYTDLARLQNVAAASVTAHNLGGYSANGAATAGAAIAGTAQTDFLTGRSGDDEIQGLAGDDTLIGGAGDDVLRGGEDHDLLDGELGNDELYGGNGNDLLTDSGTGDDQLYGEGGNDLLAVDRQAVLFAFAAPPGTLLLDGGDGDDRLSYLGRDLEGDVTLLGGADDDVISVYGGGAVTIDGGDGAERIIIDVSATSYSITFGDSPSDGDTLELAYSFSTPTSFTVHDFTAGNGGDVIEMANFLGGYLFDWDPLANPYDSGHLLLAQSGTDALILVDRNGGGDGFALLGRLENVDAAQLTELNLDFVAGPVAIAGTADADVLVGGAGADRILGFAGNDRLDGKAGVDRLEGGLGDDLYSVDHADDLVIENEDEGRDVVYASATYSLREGTHVEVLSAANQSATTALILAGNEFDQDIYGNAGNNLLQGGGGSDYLVGLGGDDQYIVVGSADRIVELAGQGRDVLYALGNYTLAAGASIEVLSTGNQAATLALELVGNELDQDIYGNAGNNLLQGGGGNDFLIGLQGDDQYIVLGNNDRVVEIAGQGRDVVYTKGDYTLDVSVSVEILSAADQSATTAMRLTGSSQDQEIYGNAGANVLDGGGGTDYMGGLGGNDTYFVSGAGDHIIEAAGQGSRDVVYARASYTLEADQDIEVLASTQQTATTAMSLTGNNLVNELYGNDGANTLNGGAGSDFLMGFGGADIFAFTTTLGAGNVDQIIDFSVADDTIALDDAVFTGLATGALAAGAFVNGSAAADADDRVLYNSATGQILFDADGNGAGVAVLFATVSAGTVLTANDFTVI
jgi:Ca2+-binding RTX toxin-like protein